MKAKQRFPKCVVGGAAETQKASTTTTADMRPLMPRPTSAASCGFYFLKRYSSSKQRAASCWSDRFQFHRRAVGNCHVPRVWQSGSIRSFASAKQRTKKSNKRSVESKKSGSNMKPRVVPEPAAPQVPPAYLLSTASPNVFVASCAARVFEIDHQSLFSDILHEPPSMFRSSTFEYFNPKSFKDEFPKWNIPEVAFLGRSNVGKSSLVNALMRSNLAKCSKQPGRTQQVNYFALYPNTSSSTKKAPSDATGFLVDLPGYGYAKAPDKNVDHWQQATQEFLQNRLEAGVMRNVFCLVDARRGTTQFDRAVMGWFDEAGIPYTIVLTKADRVGRPQLIRFVNDVCMRYHSQLYGREEHEGSQAPMVHITSSKTGEGIWELMSSIEMDFCLGV